MAKTLAERDAQVLTLDSELEELKGVLETEDRGVLGTRINRWMI